MSADLGLIGARSTCLVEFSGVFHVWAFAPAAWLCLNGADDTSCADARAIAAARPELRRAALRLERPRTTDPD